MAEYSFDLNVSESYPIGRYVYKTEDGLFWDIVKENVLTETLPTNATVMGTTIEKTAGENLVFGDVVYFKSDGKAWKASANTAGTYPAMAMVTETILANATGIFLLWGTVRNDAWNWTIGGILYLSTTAGGVTQTPPNTTDNAIQILGVAHPNADTIFFKPSSDYITLL